MSRAAEMARIMMEEWPEGVSVHDFARTRFGKDTLADLKLAVEIVGELESADQLEEFVGDLRRMGGGPG